MGDFMGAAAPWLQMLAPAAQGIMGGIQLAQGLKMAKTPVPTYDIPDATTGMNKLAEANYRGESPYLVGAEESLSLNQANMATSMKNAGASPADIAKLGANTDKGILQLGMMGAEKKSNDLGIYLNTLGALAEEQKNKMNWEKLQPYMQKQQTASALQGSGLQNLYGSLGAVSNYAGAVDYRKFMEDMYNPKTNSPISKYSGDSSAGSGIYDWNGFGA